MSLLRDPDKASVKRLAWAFGCAKKDSVEETELYRLLRARFQRLEKERGKP